METIALGLILLAYYFRWWIALFVAAWVVMLVYEKYDKSARLERAKRLVKKHELLIRTCGCPAWMGAKGFEDRHVLPLALPCSYEMFRHMGSLRNRVKNILKEESQ